jgi:hypothetical protein
MGKMGKTAGPAALAVIFAAGIVVEARAGADTPKQVLEELAAASEAKDRDRFIAVVDVPEGGGEALATLIDSAFSMVKLVEATEKAYGEGKAEELGMKISNPLPVENVDKAEIEIDGDKATAKLPGGETMDFIRKNGGWLVVMPMPPDEQRDQMIKVARALKRACDKMLPKAGELPFDKFAQEWRQTMMQAIMEAQAGQ